MSRMVTHTKCRVIFDLARLRFTRAQLSANSAVLATFDLFIAGAVGAVSCVVVFVNVSIDFGLRQNAEAQAQERKKKKRHREKTGR